MKRIIAACILVLALCVFCSAESAVVFDSFCHSGDVGGPSSPLTCAITLTSGTKGVIVTVTIKDISTAPTVTSVTIGADSLSIISGSTVATGSDLERAESWGGQTTQTGSQTVSVNFTGGNAPILSIGAFSATGIDTGTPVNNGNATSTGGSPISLAMTSASGDLTVTSMITRDGVINPTTNQVEKWRDGDLVGIGGDIGPGTANPTHTWTEAIAGWTSAVMTGANFKQATAGSSQAPRSMEQFRHRRIQ